MAAKRLNTAIGLAKTQERAFFAEIEPVCFPALPDAYTPKKRSVQANGVGIGLCGVLAGRRLRLGGRVLTGSWRHADGTVTYKWSRWVEYTRIVEGVAMEGLALVPESEIAMSDVIHLCYNNSHRKGVSPRATNTGDRVINIEKVTTMSNDTSEVIELPLTKGYIAFIDPVDSDLAEFKWTANVDSKNGVVYVHRHKPKTRSNMKLHRVIMARILGRDLLPGERVDHWDHNGLNNRRSNLRLATPSQNAINSRLAQNNTSGFKGVSWYKKTQKWKAQISFRGKRLGLGYFVSPQEAYAAYCEAAIRLYGNFACIEKTDNLPEPKRLIREMTDVSESRFCVHCGKLLERQVYTSGARESLVYFKARKFCNRECYAKHGRFQFADRGAA